LNNTFAEAERIELTAGRDLQCIGLVIFAVTQLFG
jgi:hypothetical protein